MNSKLKKLSELAAKANDLFYGKFENVDTLMGIMDKALRKQGMQADAITIDCIAQDKKIVILSHDDQPDSVNITLGNKAGDIFSSTQYPLTQLSEAFILEIMTTNFT
jgi:hypothetical protein